VSHKTRTRHSAEISHPLSYVPAGIILHKKNYQGYVNDNETESVVYFSPLTTGYAFFFITSAGAKNVRESRILYKNSHIQSYEGSIVENKYEEYMLLVDIAEMLATYINSSADEETCQDLHELLEAVNEQIEAILEYSEDEEY
jgi:hypothetical protein